MYLGSEFTFGHMAVLGVSCPAVLCPLAKQYHGHGAHMLILASGIRSTCQLNCAAHLDCHGLWLTDWSNRVDNTCADPVSMYLDPDPCCSSISPKFWSDSIITRRIPAVNPRVCPMHSKAECAQSNIYLFIYRVSRFEGSDLVQFYSFFLQQNFDGWFRWMSWYIYIYLSVLSFFGFNLETDVEV